MSYANTENLDPSRWYDPDIYARTHHFTLDEPADPAALLERAELCAWTPEKGMRYIEETGQMQEFINYLYDEDIHNPEAYLRLWEAFQREHSDSAAVESEDELDALREFCLEYESDWQAWCTGDAPNRSHPIPHISA